MTLYEKMCNSRIQHTHKHKHYAKKKCSFYFSFFLQTYEMSDQTWKNV